MYHEILCLYLYFQNIGKNPATLQMCMCEGGGKRGVGDTDIVNSPVSPSFMISLQGDAH